MHLGTQVNADVQIKTKHNDSFHIFPPVHLKDHTSSFAEDFPNSG